MNRKGLYSSIIDNLFKRFKNKRLSPIHNNKKKPPSSPSSSSSKKIKTPLRSWRDTITKKKGTYPRGDFHFSGQESRGAIHVSNIFRAKNKQGKGAWWFRETREYIAFTAPRLFREIPRRKIPIFPLACIYTYISVASLLLFSFTLCAHHPTVIIRLDANSLTEPRGAERRRRRRRRRITRETIRGAKRVTRISARYFFRSRDTGLTLSREGRSRLKKVEEEGGIDGRRKSFGEF